LVLKGVLLRDGVISTDGEAGADLDIIGEVEAKVEPDVVTVTERLTVAVNIALAVLVVVAATDGDEVDVLRAAPLVLGEFCMDADGDLDWLGAAVDAPLALADAWMDAVPLEEGSVLATADALG
jgi:uncharacterized protein (UPF0264 family)